MKRALEISLLLYVVALHCSMAGMEILGWLVLVLAVVWRVKSGRGFLFPKEVVLPFGFFAVAVTISLLINPALKSFWMQFGFLRFGVVWLGVFWALESLWDAKFEKRLMTVWIACVAVVGVYAVFQCLTGIDLIRPGSGALTPPKGGDLYKTPGFFSISLTFAYSFGLSLWWGALPALRERLSAGRRTSSWWWTALVIAVGMLGFFTSMSKGAWLAMFVTLFLYLALERRRLILPFMALALVVVVPLAMFTESFGSRLRKIVLMQMDASSTTRVDLWRGYWNMFEDHPVMGVGIFQGDKLLPEYYLKLGISADTLASHAHNNFLQILAGAGLLGALGFCWLIGVFFVKAWRLRRFSIWGWSTFMALLFVFLGGLTECNFIDAEVNHMIVFTWALIMVLGLRLSKSPEPSRL